MANRFLNLTLGAAAGLLASAMPSAVVAGGCAACSVCKVKAVRVVKKAVVPQQVINNSVAYYFVGAPVREAAIAEAMAREAFALVGEQTQKVTETRTTFSAQQARQEGRCACEQCKCHASAEDPPPQFSRVAGSAVLNACGRCHSGDDPKAGLSLAGELSAETRLAAIRKVTTQEMPPDKEITKEEASAVIAELLAAEK